jgi:hypothetical protein
VDFCPAGLYKCGSPPSCYEVKCPTLATLNTLTAPPPVYPPTITLLLPSSDPFLPEDSAVNRTFYLPFGQAGLLNLQPCASGGDSDGGSCAATASDPQVGGLLAGAAIDITKSAVDRGFE